MKFLEKAIYDRNTPGILMSFVGKWFTGVWRKEALLYYVV